MSAIGRFEGIEAWQVAREIVKLVYRDAASTVGELQERKTTEIVSPRDVKQAEG